MAIKELDRKQRLINGAQWRLFCGDPSDETWARHRAIVGIGRRRTLTPYEALMLWALRNWRAVCKDLGVKFASPVDLIEAEQMVDRWLVAGHQSFNATAIGQIAGLNQVEGAQLEELVRVILGKSISERTLYRIGQQRGIPAYRRRSQYNKAQIQRIIAAIVQPS